MPSLPLRWLVDGPKLDLEMLEYIRNII